MKLTLEISSGAVLDYIRREEEGGIDAAATAAKILDLGVAVMERVGSRSDADYLRLEVSKIQRDMEAFTESLPDKIAGYVRDRFDPDSEGSYTAQFSGQLDKVTAMLDPGRKDSLQEHVRQCLEDTKAGISDLLDPGRRDSFAHALHEYVHAEFGEGSLGEQKLQELKDAVDATVGAHFEELGEKLSRLDVLKSVGDRMYDKGSRYEDQVYDALAELASGRQESVERTGGTAAAGCRDKKGDFAYTLNSGGVVTVEAKCQSMTVRRAEEYLRSAVETRGSFFGIMVFREDYLPGEVSHLRISGNLVLTTDRLLATALHIAQAFDRAEGREPGALDYEAVCGKVREAVDRIGKLQVTMRNLGSHIVKTIENMDSGMKAAIEDLNGMLRLINSEGVDA